MGSAATPGITPRESALRAYGASLIATAISSLVAWALAPRMALDSLVMLYLVGVVVVAARYGRGPSIVAAVASALAFDFFFTLPFFSLRIADPRLMITVGVMLLVGVVISELTTALRERGHAAVNHARRVSVLYSLTRDLARATDDVHIHQAARRHIARAVGCEVLFLGPTDSVATDGDAIHLPLVAAEVAIGVMRVRPRSSGPRMTATQTRFLGHCARLVAGAMERERLVRAAHAAKRSADEEQLRNSLLSSVSHDLRQPLTVIEGTASSLLDGPGAPSNPVYAERVRLLVAEARQMSDTVNKILDMTRLESAPVELDRRWFPVETLVLAALERVRRCLSEHVVIPALPNEPLWVYVDALLFEKLLTNLLENAAKYSEAGSRVVISAGCCGNGIEIRVADEGCGLPAGDPDAVFRKFQRGTHRNAVPGIGLGLSICRAVVASHGGSITAHRRPTAGTEFVVTLPVLPGAPAG